MIQINKAPGQKVLELGCGDRRNPAADVAVDFRFIEGVTDFPVDLNSPDWPIGSGEFDLVFSQFCAEHISWRNTKQFLKECLRVCKPGGRLLLVVPNTEAQMRFILAKLEWDGDEGSMLFGDNDYPENTHRSAWSPRTATKWLVEAGWEDVITAPLTFNPATKPGDETDMRIDARKPLETRAEDALHCGGEPPQTHNLPDPQPRGDFRFVHTAKLRPLPTPAESPAPVLLPPAPKRVWTAAASVFDRHYFDGGRDGGGYGGEGYRDFPAHEVTARKLLERKPRSFLELGAGRGYVAKRLHDAGLLGLSVDVSHHCELTRVTDPFLLYDLTDAPWPLPDQSYDLSYSLAALEHIEEEKLPAILMELKRTCARGVHGVFCTDQPSNPDGTKRTLRSLSWWRELFDRHGLTMADGWEVCDKNDLEDGPIPQDYVRGDGRLKVNLCSFTTCFHQGWLNIDAADLAGWAQTYGYQYARHDIRQGLPFASQVVDCLFMHHGLEHFNRKEGVEILRECRRVIRPDGAMRIAVPNAEALVAMYREGRLGELDEMNGGCAEATTQVGKLWAMLGQGHSTALDSQTLSQMLSDSGWLGVFSDFRLPGVVLQEPARPAQLQILKECIEMSYGGTSLFVDALPLLG